MSEESAWAKRFLEKRGCDVAIAEHWNAFANKHQDLWGFADLEVCVPGRIGILYLQVTDPSNMSKRVTKVLSNAHVINLLLAANRIEVWGVGIWKTHGRCRIGKITDITVPKGSAFPCAMPSGFTDDPNFYPQPPSKPLPFKKGAS